MSALVDFKRAQSARIENYFLGGKDNFPVDREVGTSALSVFSDLWLAARARRAFLCRAVAFLAGAGFRRFLDVGVGLPASPDLHEVAQGVVPAARVVYVDRDPLVLLHARALLASGPRGCVEIVDADLRDPAKILALACFDEGEPVVLSLSGVLPFVSDGEDPYGIVAQLLAGLPAGSALLLDHLTADYAPEAVAGLVAVYKAADIPLRARSREQVARFVAGLEVLGPGLVSCQRWNPDPTDLDDLPADGAVSCYGVVARL
ncbi:SAM-dependent methyltransferase [Frankia sp. AgB1.9]|uniref:SAM-dependent methyltransferase n=1 Tax=unclassified Frankia TaxID=2632575 RepID=UPI001934AD02|nr:MULTISPECIES: SAM-dependent methyltransferase [unclassified Frankia]MBL7489726.1 SAM-dependent methyltransferase [Frankia sp. AgW1.1]MBL7551936.1 SAM-dependent methyltransferase [Frankia sp. AgB1.9]MBL7623225.1 SAM-dependent methyltransferase [Frankia sp. AgB1.8]